MWLNYGIAAFVGVKRRLLFRSKSSNFLQLHWSFKPLHIVAELVSFVANYRNTGVITAIVCYMKRLFRVTTHCCDSVGNFFWRRPFLHRRFFPDHRRRRRARSFVDHRRRRAQWKRFRFFFSKCEQNLGGVILGSHHDQKKFFFEKTWKVKNLLSEF